MNYSLVVNSSFKPFSYQEMLAPVLMATQAHQELENQYGELATKASVWEEMANEQTDPHAYKMYKTYADDLEKQAGQLAREGLNATSRKNMLNMRARYAKEITPIEQAFLNRAKEIEELRAGKAKGMVYEGDASIASLDRYLNNPSIRYGMANAQEGFQRVAATASAISKRLRAYGRGRALDGFTKTWLQEHGYRDNEVGLAITDIEEALRGNGNVRGTNILTNILANEMLTAGVNNWNTAAKMDYYNRIAPALYLAVGQTLVGTYLDLGAIMAAQEAAQIRAENRANTRKTRDNNTPPKPEKGLPIDIHNLNNNNYNESAKLKLYGLLDELGVSRGGINGKHIRSKEETRGTRSDLLGAGIATIKTKDGSDRVRWFNSKGELLSKQYVLAQIDDKDPAGQRAIASKYDRIWRDLKQYGLKSSNAKTYTVLDIQKAVQGNINADSNASHTLSAVSLRLSNPSKTLSDKIIPLLLSNDGETLKMKEVKTFHNDGTLDFSKSSIDISDIMDKEGKLRGTPYFFAPPSQKGILTRLNGKMYFIEAKDLGSIGATSNSIDIPRLREAVATRNELIKEYGEEAYYSSETGKEVENVINSSGQSYLKAYIQQLDSEVETPRSKVTD